MTHRPAGPKGPALRARRPASELIDAVVANMRQNLEQLKYSTLAPSRYVIYLHSSEYARLETILPIVREQTIRALSEALDTLNRPSLLQRYSRRLVAAGPVPVESAGHDWHVEFVCDADNEIEEGGLAIDSEMRLPSDPELGLGERTRLMTTRIAANNATAEQRTESRPTESLRVVARLTYRDDDGQHAYDITKEIVTIGRGRIARPVDVRIVSAADVSREHARIRRNAATGQFFLVDLSSLGTTVNGRQVPRGYGGEDGAKRENGAETLLPERARIGLAELVFLDFEVAR